MTNRIRTVKKKLDDVISQLCEVSWMFTKNPEKDFTRSRKLSFRKVISYNMRWGIETSFRELKYTIGLHHFHAKKVAHIYQEVFARLIMYNFTELVTSPVIIQKADCKYAYNANFSVAVHVCRQFFLGNVSPPDVEALF